MRQPEVAHEDDGDSKDDLLTASEDYFILLRYQDGPWSENVLEIQTGGLRRASIDAVVKDKWPALERLELWFGDDDYGAEGKVSQIKPLLDATNFPKLKHIGLMNAQFTDDICRAIVRSKVVTRLEVLHLSMRLMSNDGAAVLADKAKALSYLERLDVSDNDLDAAAKEIIRPFGKKLVFGHQKDPDRDGEEYRYVSAAE